MYWLHALLLVLTVALPSALHAATGTKPRGVMDALAAHYTSSDGLFKCLTDGNVVPSRYINDEYCDCADGSDEPGTAACTYLVERSPGTKSKLRFQCDNRGFEVELLHHSRVNDGICDCCDGSDEYEGRVSCPNNCDVVQERLRREAAEREARRQQGLTAKAALLAEAVRLKADATQKIAAHKAALATIDGDIKQAEARRDEWNTKEQSERDEIHRKSLAAKEVWEEEQRQKKQLREEAERASPPNSDTVKPFKPSNLVCTSWRQTKNCRGDSVRDPGADKPCHVAVDGTASGYCECVDSRTGLDIKYPFDCGHRRLSCNKMCEVEGTDEGYLPDNAVDAPPAEETFKVDTGDGHTLPEAADARRAYDDIVRKKEDAQREVRELEQFVSGDAYGPGAVFLPLKGRCFEKIDGHYTYSLCLFDRVRQGHTNMGLWKSWGEQTYGSWGSSHDFAVMTYADGDRCWSGPARSTEVRVVCGAENRLVSVDEPSMCTYKMVFETPAICE